MIELGRFLMLPNFVEQINSVCSFEFAIILANKGLLSLWEHLIESLSSLPVLSHMNNSEIVDFLRDSVKVDRCPLCE